MIRCETNIPIYKIHLAESLWDKWVRIYNDDTFLGSIWVINDAYQTYDNKGCCNGKFETWNEALVKIQVE